MGTTSGLTVEKPRYPGRWYAVLGIVIALLGLLGYALQIYVLKLLVVPWYAPVFGLVGAGLLVFSLFQARSILRIVGVILFGLLAVGVCYFVLAFSRLPEYTGPVKEKKPVPVFKTVRADGTPFTQKDLRRGKDTVMIFFRGRW
jgi:hypothetical protein